MNNVTWDKVHDVDQESNCCCGYIDITTTDGELGHAILRVWPWQLAHTAEAVRNLSIGKDAESQDKVLLKFHPRGFFDWLTCYRGYCWCYHPVEYRVCTSGLRVRQLRCVKPQGGVFRSRLNHIPWRLLRDVDSKSDCCWGYVDIDTNDAEAPHILVRVGKSELEGVLRALRDHRAFCGE